MRSVKERLFSIYYAKTSSVYAALSSLTIKTFHRAFTRYSLQGIEYSIICTVGEYPRFYS